MFAYSIIQQVFFVFGIRGEDNGRIFDPDDDGHLEYDPRFDFLDPESQVWLNHFINVSVRGHPELFLGAQIVQEWNDYLISIQQLCWKTLARPADKIFVPHIPYERESLSRCRLEIASFLQNSSVRNFESMMASFPRRIIFIAKGNEVTGIVIFWIFCYRGQTFIPGTNWVPETWRFQVFFL